MAFNAWMLKTRTQAVFSPVGFMETIEAFRHDPMHAGAMKRCSWYLAVEDWIALGNPAAALANELAFQGCGITPAKPLETENLRSDLELASAGRVRPELVQRCENHFAIGRQSTQRAVAEILSRPLAERLKSFVTFQEALTSFQSDAASVADELLRPTVKLRVPDATGAQLARVVELILADPSTVPTAAGIVRINLYSNWKAARHGTITEQDDLKLVQSCLGVSAVYSKDHKLLKRGKSIFPEVEWRVPPDLTEHLNDPEPRTAIIPSA